MIKREDAIEKLEGWARWEMGGTRENEPGAGAPAGSSFLPGDQADYLTVEMALKDYEGTRHRAGGLRLLLLHVYGHDLDSDCFDSLAVEHAPEGRGIIRKFLAHFGWRPDNFSQVCAQRFVRFLGHRL